MGAVSLHNVVVVVGPLEGGLHAGQLMLDSIQLHTSLLSGLSDLAHFFLFLTEGEVYALMLIRELLGEGILQTGHQWLS